MDPLSLPLVNYRFTPLPLPLVNYRLAPLFLSLVNYTHYLVPPSSLNLILTPLSLPLVNYRLTPPIIIDSPFPPLLAHSCTHTHPSSPSHAHTPYLSTSYYESSPQLEALEPYSNSQGPARTRRSWIQDFKNWIQLPIHISTHTTTYKYTTHVIPPTSPHPCCQYSIMMIQ